ncbi:MAG: hypothetical protein JOZ39_00340 [Chloroflexi bacterium]|nr:hypothetical protein [Chloroflexota bacterium]
MSTRVVKGVLCLLSLAAPALGPATNGVWHAADSSNWAGYAASGGTFTSVSGTWTVPAGGGNGTDATWVGIGGDKTHDLIQAGTENIVRGGRVSHDAWVEMLPAASRPVNLPVHAGDTISVSLAQSAPSQWQVTINNTTTGQQFQATEQYSSSLSSAEWIEEAPSNRQTVLPLDDFGTIAFSGATAVENGQQVSISQANGQAITMIRGRQALATPSALGADGQSFSVSFDAAGAISGTPPVVTEPFPCVTTGPAPRFPVDPFPFPRIRRGRGID